MRCAFDALIYYMNTAYESLLSLRDSRALRPGEGPPKTATASDPPAAEEGEAKIATSKCVSEGCWTHDIFLADASGNDKPAIEI